MPMPWGLVISACIGMFAATASGSTRAPFLPDMALDLGVEGAGDFAQFFGLGFIVLGRRRCLLLQDGGHITELTNHCLVAHGGVVGQLLH